MSKKYNEIDALRIIKDLFNLIYGDSKRFATLRNKFKLSVDTYKENNGKVVSIIFNAVSNDVINKELNDAIESLRRYAARSAKKQAEFNAIIEGEGIDVDTAKVSKPKSSKVKKVAKDSSLPKEKEPKEVKRVKGKNEPVKKAVKAPAKKAAKPVVSKVSKEPKEETAVNNVNDMIKKYVQSLSSDNVLKLIGDVSNAFAGDAKFNTTMNNWKTKTKTDLDAAIGMLTTAYTRKPKNTKMKVWYELLEATFMAPDNTEVKQNPEAVKETEVSHLPFEEETTPVGPIWKGIPGILSKKVITDFSRFKGAESANDFLADIFDNNIPSPREYIIGNADLEDAFQAVMLLNSSVFTLLDTKPDELLGIEANILSRKIQNTSITSTFMQNFIMYINKAPGIGTLPERKQCIEGIKFSILEFLEANNVVVDMAKDDAFGFYMNNTLKLTMLQVYTLNRYILTSVLSLSAVDQNEKMVNKILSVSLEYFINSNYFEELKMECIPFIMMDSDVANDSVDSVSDAPEINHEVADKAPVEVIKEEADSDTTEKELPSRPEIKYTITYSELSFVLNGTQITVQKNEEKYPAILEAVKASDYDSLNQLVVTETSIKENIQSFLSDIPFNELDDGEELQKIKIDIVDKMLICNGKKFGGTLSLEFIKYASQNDITNIAQFKRFIYNCSLNPSANSVNELYDFVIKNKLKVTPSGSILLYKWVRDNYFDAHTGKFDNSPGKTVWMDRAKVNSNRNETCSNGLHLCSFGYSKFSQRLLICELHPKNSVSIPTDYNQSKMRCCEYSVLLDVTEYYAEMVSKGDYLSKGDTFHHNSKILELAIMQHYPNVTRTNSFNGFNGKKGKDIDFSDIDFGKVAPMERVEFTDDSDEETCEVAALEVIESKEETLADIQPLIGDIKVEETCTTQEMLKVETEEETEEVEEVEEVEAKSMMPDPAPTMMNQEVFIDFMVKGDMDTIRKVKGHEKFLNNAVNNGLDTFILDIVLFKLKLTKPLDNLRVYDVVEIYSEYKNIVNNETSTVDRTNADIVKANEIESSKVIDETSNTDGTKVVETPQTKSTGLFGKVKKFFGGN